MQRAQLTAEAHATMASQASSSDQRLSQVTSESNQQIELVRQWAQQRSIDLERDLEAARADGATLNQHMARATSEADHLRLQLGHAAHMSQS